MKSTPLSSLLARSALVLGALLAFPLGTRAAQTVVDPWANVKLPDLSSLGTNVRDLDRVPKVTKQAPPKFPEHLKLSGVTGSVEVGFIVGPDGHVRNLRVIDSSVSDFERAALDAVSVWTFEPGVKDGKTVSTNMAISFNFNLNPGGPAPKAPARTSPSQSAASKIGGNGSGPVTFPDIPPPAPTYAWEIVAPKSFPPNFPENFKFTQPPEPIRTGFPIYPMALLAAGTKGKVNVGIVINPAGRISEVNVIGAPPPREFEMAVRAMLDTWTFKPARKDGQPCFCAATFSVEFNPSGTSTVPVSDTARRILAESKKKAPKIVELEALDELPERYSRKLPGYPLLPAGMRPAGSAVVEFYIDENGDAQLPHAVSADNDSFGAAAIQAVSTWKFAPPKKDKKPVIALARTVVQFTPPAAPR